MKISSALVEKWERKYVDCVGQYVGPELPGFPWHKFDVIHAGEITEAASLYRWALADQKDRVACSIG